MRGEPSLFDYVIIVCLAAGVAALGAEELYRRNGSKLAVQRSLNNSKHGSVIAESREDLSARFAEGAPVEVLTPKTESERRARYGWEDSSRPVKKQLSKRVVAKPKGIIVDIVDTLLGPPPKKNLTE